jgi:hypothetical protein
MCGMTAIRALAQSSRARSVCFGRLLLDTRPYCSARSGRAAGGLDVRLQPEQVGRVIGGLECAQPLVVRAEGRLHHGVALFLEAGEVEIARAVTELGHRIDEVAHPGDVVLVGGRIVLVGLHVEMKSLLCLLLALFAQECTKRAFSGCSHTHSRSVPGERPSHSAALTT